MLSSTVDSTTLLLQSYLKVYPSVMVLKMYVDNDSVLRNQYEKVIEKQKQRNIHEIDAGVDLYIPIYDEKSSKNKVYEPIITENKISCYKINHLIKCSAKIHCSDNKSYNTSYYLYPRSSLSKSCLRMANSVGIIDAGYRGHIIGVFDTVYPIYDSLYNKYERLLQICAPSLMPIILELVNKEEELGERTERGEGGFGSTG